MKVLIINSVIGVGSTGKICLSLAERLADEGHEVVIAYGRQGNADQELVEKYGRKIGSKISIGFHFLLTRLFDKQGFGSFLATKRFVKWIDEYKPDLIWMHNIHGYYLNVAVLFNYLKAHPEIEKRWTFHDCWPITGHCAYFEYARCKKWQSGCEKCPLKKEYPTSLLCDNSAQNYQRKKTLFTGVANMSLIVPSAWLKSILANSFMREYPATIQYNTIDRGRFTYHSNDLKKRFGVEGKTVLLGVANIWERRKGFEEFAKLSTMLGDSFVIIIVGMVGSKQERLLQSKGFVLTKHVDGNCEYQPTAARSGCPYAYSPISEIGKVIFPDVDSAFNALTGETFVKTDGEWPVHRVILVEKTESVDALVDFYSAADVLLNPTFDENYPTVNLEALSVGTKVITYDTGGCKETIENFEKGLRR